jgi:hypothetical protein
MLVNRIRLHIAPIAAAPSIARAQPAFAQDTLSDPLSGNTLPRLCRLLKLNARQHVSRHVRKKNAEMKAGVAEVQPALTSNRNERERLSAARRPRCVSRKSLLKTLRMRDAFADL